MKPAIDILFSVICAVNNPAFVYQVFPLQNLKND